MKTVALAGYELKLVPEYLNPNLHVGVHDNGVGHLFWLPILRKDSQGNPA